MSNFECSHPEPSLPQDQLEAYARASAQAATAAMERYAQAMYEPGDPHQFELQDRSHRLRDYVNVFAGGMLPPEALDAAALYDLTAESTKSAAAMQAVASARMDYYSAPGTRRGSEEYVAALINDMAHIDNEAKWYRNHKAYIEHTSGHYDIWEHPLPPAAIKDMARLGSEVNLESVIIKACEQLDGLVLAVNGMVKGQYQPGEQDLATLEAVIEAESFYGPLCEIIGFDGLAMELRSDGLAMELRSQARQLRMFRQGKGDIVMQAYDICREGRQYGPQAVLGNLVQFGGDFAVSSVVNEPEYNRHYANGMPYASVQLGEFALDLGDGVAMAGNWRLKSVGSLAHKMAQPGAELPMDVMGLTAISDDPAELAQNFAAVVERAASSLRLEPRPAPSKEKWAIVQGDDEYIATVCSQLSPAFIADNVQIISRPRGYRVAKFTCLAAGGNLPVEMQFVTKADHCNGRTGEDAHIFHKAGADGVSYTAEQRRQAAPDLAELNRRAQHMVAHHGELTINPRSLYRSETDLVMTYLLSD